MNYFIIVLMIIIIVIIVTIVLLKRKQTSSFDAIISYIDELKSLMLQIDEEMIKINEISTTEDSKEILDIYYQKREELNKKLQTINNEVEDLKTQQSLFKIKEYEDEFNDIEDNLKIIEKEINQLLKNTSSYAQISLYNEKICLTSKSLLKNTQHNFEMYLKPLEVYNNDFNSIVTEINNSLLEYEALQTENEFDQARCIISSCVSKVKLLEKYTTIIAASFDTLNNQIPSLIEKINLILKEINELGYQLQIRNLDDLLNEIIIAKDDIINKLLNLNYFDLNLQALNEIKNEIDALCDNAKGLLNEIVQQYELICVLISIENNNQEKIAKANEIFELAIIEVAEIKQKYQINSTIQMDKIDKLKEQYELFLEDYEKLLTIIHDAKEDFDKLINRAKQAEAFLQRILLRLKEDVKELAGFRYYEKNGHDIIAKYENYDVEIMLYLKRNHHDYLLSPQLQQLISKTNDAYQLLKEELNNDIINIMSVNELSEKVEENYQNIVGDETKLGELQKDIIQKIGCNNLIKCLGRLANQEKIEEALRSLHIMYKNCEYAKCYTLAYNVLKTNVKNGEAIFKKLVDVKKIPTIPFSPILKPYVINDKELS